MTPFLVLFDICRSDWRLILPCKVRQYDSASNWSLLLTCNCQPAHSHQHSEVLNLKFTKYKICISTRTENFTVLQFRVSVKVCHHLSQVSLTLTSWLDLTWLCWINEIQRNILWVFAAWWEVSTPPVAGRVGLVWANFAWKWRDKFTRGSSVSQSMKVKDVFYLEID